MDELKKRISGLLEEICDDPDGGIQIYTDYSDRYLSNYCLRLMFENDEPREVFREMLDERTINYDCEYGKDDVINTVCEKLNTDELALFKEHAEEMKEYINENVYYYFNEEEFNTDVNVNIMVDCGNGNYDYAKDNVLNWDGRYSEGKLEEESSILWLAKTQNKGTALKDACKKAFNGCEYERKDKFVESCVQELENLPTCMGTITFLVKMPLFEVFKLLELQKKEYDEKAKYDPRLNESKAYILLGKETMCGLYNPWNGGGSVMEVQLDKDVRLPVMFAEICVEGCKSRGYDVGEVYGLCKDCWKESVKKIQF